MAKKSADVGVVVTAAGTYVQKRRPCRRSDRLVLAVRVDAATFRDEAGPSGLGQRLKQAFEQAKRSFEKTGDPFDKTGFAEEADRLSTSVRLLARRS